MTERLFRLPDCLVDAIPEDQYRKWLHRKALALARRDRGRGFKSASLSSYKRAIHEGIIRDGARDWYTGEALDWSLISSYRNDASKAAGRAEKRRLAKMPTVDHEDGNLDAPRFRICGWAMNDAKNDLSLEEFLDLCSRVLKHHGATRRAL